MTSAQNWLNNISHTIANPKATLTKIKSGGAGPTEVINPRTTGKLIGSLKIEGYTALTEINLGGNEITELEIINCPNLTEINFSGNRITKIDLTKIKMKAGTGEAEDNLVKDLYIGGDVANGDNDIRELDLTHFVNLEKLLVQRNRKLDKIRGIHKLVNISWMNTEGAGDIIRHVAKGRVVYLEDLGKLAKKLLGEDPDKPLPNKYKKPDKSVDLDKVENEIKNKVVNSSPLNNDKATAERERDEAKAKLEAQKDYGEIKTEWDQLKQNFQAIAKKLGLNEQSTQAQLLTKIEALVAKPNSDNSDKISYLEGRLSGKDQQIGELKNWKKQND